MDVIIIINEKILLLSSVESFVDCNFLKFLKWILLQIRKSFFGYKADAAVASEL